MYRKDSHGNKLPELERKEVKTKKKFLKRCKEERIRNRK